MDFKLISDFTPIVPQKECIDFLIQGLKDSEKHQVLQGITGSGKTFMVAGVIESLNKPTLVISHNKTLCAQLYNELKEFFPNNAVEYFISYYDYYQPEAYVPGRDLYIEKTAEINDEIDKFRHMATRSLFERRDVIIVASVSCIYGLGSPELYAENQIALQVGQIIDRSEITELLIATQYERNDIQFTRGKFRIRGDTVDIQPASDQIAIRLELFGEELEKILRFHPITGEILGEVEKISIFPARHYLVPDGNMEEAFRRIKKELEGRIEFFNQAGKLVEAQRLESRTNYDLEMLKEVGYCQGIENYSRHLALRGEGEPPETLLDYFPEDALIIIDESHVSLPQLHGMFKGDLSRKNNLVEYGYRLPSARDNRPLKYEEFLQFPQQRIYLSATPAHEELDLCGARAIEQVIRPTGILDPEIEVVSRDGQIDHLIDEISQRTERDERSLVMVMTKKMAEKLNDYLQDKGIKSRYLHSEINSLERIEIIRDLRVGEFDVIVGINLLREGLDLPEVSLIAIFDADKEGFLRSQTSLLQIAGRAARNVNGKVVFYADTISSAMKSCIEITNSRRKFQDEYNRKNGVNPSNIQKKVFESMRLFSDAQTKNYKSSYDGPEDENELNRLLTILYENMQKAGKKMEFEKAAQMRDTIIRLKSDYLDLMLTRKLAKK
ncbi:excinuclease ABC subunit UvrB [Candidatus Riflebacteria bacterium]